jgi:hypothetical protein
MKFVKYKNADTFFDFYMFQINTINDIKNYWNRKRCIIHFEEFRELSLHYHSQMLQSLSIQIEIDLESRVDFVNLNKEIDIHNEKLQSVVLNEQSQKNRARRKKLYWKKRQFVSEELSKWQKIQTHKMSINAKNDASSVANQLSYFNNIRRLNSSRDRLASSLFFHAFLRSSQNRRAFQNMSILCRNNSFVTYRSSLKSKNDCCLVSKCERKMNKYVACFLHFRLACLNWLWYNIDIIFK